MSSFRVGSSEFIFCGCAPIHSPVSKVLSRRNCSRHVPIKKIIVGPSPGFCSNLNPEQFIKDDVEMSRFHGFPEFGSCFSQLFCWGLPSFRKAGRQVGRSAGRQILRSAGRQVGRSADPQVGGSAGRQVQKSADQLFSKCE